jgi:hypothetical protein
MTALERFKELLKTATPEARELVEAFHYANETWFHTSRNYPSPAEQIKDTPQAAAPVSVERIIEIADGDLYILVTEDKMPKDWNHGDRVLIAKIEGAK